MNGTATPPGDQAPPPPPLPPPPSPNPGDLPPPAATQTRPIFGGVCALLGDRLAIDATWIRIGFVLAALADGLGLVLYAALWLILVAGRAQRSVALSILGGLLLLFGLPLITGGLLLDGPLVVLFLLMGLTFALWQPRRESDAGEAPSTPAYFSGTSTPTAPPLATKVAAPRQPRREPSALGAITLGSAMVVAAVGALIDQANGGRLHPEQWLGAATVVLGIGLLVGTIRGHARWLIVPALAVAALGAFIGQMARLDISAGQWSGDHWVEVWADTSGPIAARTGLGGIRISVREPPSNPLTIDARVAVGQISVDTETRVAVDIHHNGAAPERLGRADGPADVVVNARTGFGQLDLGQWTIDFADDADPPGQPIPGRPEGLGDLTQISDGVTMTNDGWVLLANGEVVIDDQNEVVVGHADDDGTNVLRFHTSFGEFSLLPRGLLMTNSGDVVDLEVVRGELVEAPTSSTTTDVTTPYQPEGAQP